MSKKRTRKTAPSYRLHKASQNAYMELGGKRIYLGKHGTPESREAYYRTLAEWEANGRVLSVSQEEITVVEIIAQYLRYADVHYRKPNGKQTSEFGNIVRASKLVKKLYGSVEADGFTPRALKVLQNEWVKTGIARTTVNRYVGIVRRMFKWAASEGLIDANVYLALQTIEGLRKGRTLAPDHDPVGIVSYEQIEAVNSHVSAEVWALIQLQLATGARSGEIVGLRLCDIDRSAMPWKARLTEHKTAHEGKMRTLYFGPAAREVLTPFLFGKKSEDCLFSPVNAERSRRSCDAEGKRRDGQSETPRTTQRKIGRHYTTQSYGRAVSRACKEAGIQSWTPHQLRHTAATRFREEYGLELTQKLLGHAHARITEVYAEVDEARLIPAVERNDVLTSMQRQNTI